MINNNLTIIFNRYLVDEMVHRSQTFMLFPPPMLCLLFYVYSSLVRHHSSLPSSSSPPSPSSSSPPSPSFQSAMEQLGMSGEINPSAHWAAVDDLSSFIFLRFVCPSLVNLHNAGSFFLLFLFFFFFFSFSFLKYFPIQRKLHRLLCLLSQLGF